MGLLWTFMGASPAYQMFAGWSEVLGCVLLMFRRTTTLGALVLLGVLTNVFLLDMFFDVPAKLCVLHLLAMCVVLLSPNTTRLIDVFVRNRAVAPVDLGPPPSHAQRIAQIAFVILVLWVEAVPVGRFYFTERDGAPLPALYGAYEVEELDASHWRWIAIDRRRLTGAVPPLIRRERGSRARQRHLDTFRRVARRGRNRGRGHLRRPSHLGAC
jgi:hypothetical protein